MSRLTNEIGQVNENRDHQYQEMVRRIQHNSCAPLDARNEHESIMGLPTHHESTACSTTQFYQGFNPRGVATSSYAPSSLENFRWPQTTLDYRRASAHKARLEVALASFGQVQEPEKCRFFVRVVELLAHLLMYNTSELDSSALMDALCVSFKEKYCRGNAHRPNSVTSMGTGRSEFVAPYGNLPRTISTSTEHSQVFNPYGNLSSLHRNQATQYMEPRVMVHDVCQQPSTTSQQPREPPQNNGVENRGIDRPPPRKATQKQMMEASRALDESSISLFSETITAQRIDKIAARQAQQSNMGPPTTSKVKATPRPTVRASKVKRLSQERTLRKKRKSSSTPKSTNVLECTTTTLIGCKRVSRTGRMIRSPRQFWACKGNESKINETLTNSLAVAAQRTKNDLNGSMILRSSRVVGEKFSQKQSKGVAKNTPLSSILENGNVPVAAKPQATKKDGKENSTQNRKYTKKQSGSNEKQTKAASKKINESQKKPNKTTKIYKAVANESENVSKKPQKMKSKEASNCVPKKKKLEAVQALNDSADNSSDDELFGAIAYRKKTRLTLQAVSPSNGILSAKKAAGVALSKETPPCKALGQMINCSDFSADSSATEDAPTNKLTQVVKRVTKNLENNKKKASNKTAAETDSSKLSKTRENLVPIGSCKSTNPLSIATYTMFLGNLQESDEEFEEDGYDDDNEYDDDDLN